MSYQSLIGDPLITGIIVAGAASFIVALAWIALALRRTTPELLQLMAFQGLNLLKNAVISACLSVIIQTVLLAIFFADFALPMAVLVAGATISTILFWYAVYLFAKAFHIPRARRRLGRAG